MTTEYDDGTISTDLEAREALYEDLVTEVPEEVVLQQIEIAVNDAVTGMYDRREQLAEQVQQQMQQ
jgi:hypothetical protein